MSKKRAALLTICILFLAVCACYFLLALYYGNGFGVNTWINGVYCTGKSVEEVNSELLSCMEAPNILIVDKDGNRYFIDLKRVDYKGDYLPPLNAYLKEQNSLLWMNNLARKKDHALSPAVTYDEEKLREAFRSLEPVRRELFRQEEYALFRDEEKGWQLYDGLTDRLDIEKAYEALKTVVDQGGHTLDLAEEDCYYDLPLTEEQKTVKRLWEALENFQDCDIVYDMGDAMLAISPKEAACFVAVDEKGMPLLDEKGQPVLSEAAVRAYIASLADRYDTYEKEREFLSTRGEIVTVAGGTYGTKLDQEAESAYLMENLLKPDVHTGIDLNHKPAYEKETTVRGRNDIGDTYIEVDMTQQKLYYYEDGELMLETDVVTGNMKRRMGTPEGVNFVYNKQKNRTLRGPGYATPVKYWMPVKGNIGIHDAGWRSEFGGSIYEKNGSHGCVNTPTDKMAELYDMVEIGTPVVMFY